ncbi:hypothetical protein [Pseudomonas helleri]|uniref:hypothetical protein n=1 Tax=Pseudomonas helleri TaxID=1608996 RepID=UPI002F35AF61
MARKLIEEFVTLPDGSVVKNHLRHDFDKPTKLLLQHMVAGVCSNPDCVNHTIGSNIQRNSYAGNGIAAHICAAAPGAGAARYDKNQTKEERQSYKNGLWLCGSCSIIIDRDEARYPVALLHEWKSKAELRAMTMVGQKSITPFELQNSVREAIIQTVQSLSTGNNLHKPSPEKFDVSAVVEGYEQSINSIDQNFKVVVTATSDSVVHELIPITDPAPEIQMVFNDDAIASADLAWQKMIEVGESIHIPTNDFKFVGSKLFEYLNEVIVGGTLTLAPSKRRLETCIYFVSDEAEFELATTDSFMGKGSKQFDIEGSALDGFFTYRYFIHDRYKVEATYTFDVAGWFGQPINNLRHYHRIKKAYDFVVKYPKSTVSIEVVLNEHPMRLWDGTSSDFTEFFARLKKIVEVAECSKVIASKMSNQLRLKTLDLTLQDERYIELYAELFKGDVIRKLDYGEKIFTARVDAKESKAIKTFCSENEPEVIIVKSPTIDFFGNTVSLPRMSKKITCFDLVFFSSILKEDWQSLWCIGRANHSSDSVISIAPDEIPLLCSDEDVING